MFLTRVHGRVLQTGLAQLSSSAPTALRRADRAHQAAISDLTHSARNRSMNSATQDHQT